MLKTSGIVGHYAFLHILIPSLYFLSVDRFLGTFAIFLMHFSDCAGFTCHCFPEQLCALRKNMRKTCDSALLTASSSPMKIKEGHQLY